MESASTHNQLELRAARIPIVHLDIAVVSGLSKNENAKNAAITHTVITMELPRCAAYLINANEQGKECMVVKKYLYFDLMQIFNSKNIVPIIIF